VSRYSFGSLIPASSNPRDIYHELRRAVETPDKHNSRIVGTRAFYVQHAAALHAEGKLSEAERDELIYFVTSADIKLWTPLLYLVERAAVAGRLEIVPPSKRAGHGLEYIIKDLRRTEFEIVEL
jgi:hypothetical protein